MNKLLSKEEVNQELKKISSSWNIKSKFLERQFMFKNFNDAFNFMKLVSVKCEDLNHHPKWTNVYNKVSVELYTHDLDGLTKKDFELCSFMDEIFDKN